MTKYEKGDPVKATHSIQRSSGAAWPGDRLVITGVHSPWIGADTYTVKTEGGQVLKDVPEGDLGRR